MLGGFTLAHKRKDDEKSFIPGANITLAFVDKLTCSRTLSKQWLIYSFISIECSCSLDRPEYTDSRSGKTGLAYTTSSRASSWDSKTHCRSQCRNEAVGCPRRNGMILWLSKGRQKNDSVISLIAIMHIFRVSNCCFGF